MTASEVDALDFMFREVRPRPGSIDDDDDATDATDGRRAGRLSASTGLFGDGLVPSTAIRD